MEGQVGGDLEGSPERKALAGPHFHCTFGRTTSPTDRVSSRRRTAACPSACGQKGILTNLRRNVFSRSAPMHPANPKMNITPPTTRKSQTGSKPPRSVMEEMLDRTPFSFHAHSPIPRNAIPKNFSCALSRVGWIPADSRTKGLCSHGKARVLHTLVGGHIWTQQRKPTVPRPQTSRPERKDVERALESTVGYEVAPYSKQ